MSRAKIERQVRELPAAERFQFVSWVHAHEDELIQQPHGEAMAPDLMEELLSRRREMEEGNARTFTVEEMSARVQAALDEVQRSRQ